LSNLKLRLFVAFAVVAAAVCIRLGFWQVDRLHQRRARNELVRARLDSAEVDVATLPRDTSKSRFRRVRVAGTPDYDHELVLAARSRRGAPGVYVLTPMRLPGRDTAVLVNRGWVYSPDAATVELARFRGSDTAFVGYVDELEPGDVGPFPDRPHVFRRLTLGGASRAIPYPVAGYYVVASSDTSVVSNRPVQLGPPPLDEGPHFSYAIQWFGFALVALVGAVVAVMRR